MTEVLLSKLAPPRMDREILERPRVLQSLAGLDNRKATLLLAPAGYGKTVAMLQAAASAGRAFIWYQLDTYDNDPAVFIQGLAAGIRRQLPAFGGQIPQLISQGRIEQRLRLLVTSFVNGFILHAADPLLIALDDFHHLTDPLSLRFIQELLEHLPSHAHLMIASRSIPALPLARLKIANEVVLLDLEDLRFTAEETRSFLARSSTRLPAGAETTLESRLNGWPALVRLAAESGSPLDKASENAEIFEYLATEVLARLPRDAEEFLLKTSVLEVVTPEEADQLLSRHDSAAMLDRLEKESLFLARLAGAKRSYRCHQLFREFLLERLGPERAELERTAGRLAAERSDLAAAMEYYAAAGADGELAALLREAGQDAFRQGRWQTVQRWLGSLDREQISADPWLSLYQARIESYRGCMEAAANWVEAAASAFAARSDRIGLAESRLLQARILRYKGFYEQSLALLEEAYPHLRTGQDRLRFDLPVEKSLSLVMTGRFKEAEAILKSALAEAEMAREDLVVAYLLEGLGNTYYLQGEYARALQMYQKRLELAPERDFPYYYTQDFTAAIYQEWGELDQAYEYARRNVDCKESLGLTDTLPSAYFQLADIYLNRRDLKNAEEYFRRAIDLIKKTSEERFYLTLNQAYLARCLREQGRLAEAQALAEEALREAEGSSRLALAICRVLAAPIFWNYGRKQQAREMLAAAVVTLEEIGFMRPLGHAYAATALIAASEGDRAEAAKYARQTLALSAQKNFCQSFLVAFDVFQPILQFGMTQGVEVVFCQKVLARLAERSLPLLGALAKNGHPEVRRRTIMPLGEIGGEEAVAILTSLAGDDEPAVSRLAAETLARIGTRSAQAAETPPAVGDLVLNTLGPFLLARHGETAPIAWRTAKSRDLLAFLAHQAGPVDQEVILEELWPEHDPEKAKGLFHTSLYYLRRALKKAGLPALILYRNNRYQFAPGYVRRDQDQFLALIALGLRGEADPAASAARLENAVALYHGDYLAELDYPWLLPQRENLKNLCGEARIWLARHYIGDRLHGLALGHLRALVEAYPLNEEPYRLLLTALAGLGDLAAVHREYKGLKALLAKELHLAPAEETRELYQRLVGEKSG